MLHDDIDAILGNIRQNRYTLLYTVVVWNPLERDMCHSALLNRHKTCLVTTENETFCSQYCVRYTVQDQCNIYQLEACTVRCITAIHSTLHQNSVPVSQKAQFVKLRFTAQFSIQQQCTVYYHTTQQRCQLHYNRTLNHSNALHKS